MSSDTREYLSKNTSIIFWFLVWMFRLLFLQQGNEGGVAINKFVVVQIVAELGIFFSLLLRRFDFSSIFTKLPMMWFTFLYLFGMVSIFWGVFPTMGCYFAFQNIIMLSALFYLATQTKDFFQLERFYIFANLFILWLFMIKILLTGGGDFHSVAYSSVAGFMLVYCVAEYDKASRPPENRRLLRWGILWGIFGLWLTSSGGAMVSVLAGIFVLAMFARQPILKLVSFLCICVLLVAFFSGSMDWVLGVLFPGKSMASIETAHGRAYLWSLILQKAAERPWLGWGYASVERILPGIYTIDAHNSVIGVLGSLGYVGCSILIMAMLSMFLFILGKTKIIGMRGCLAACVCGLVNSNTSNFLASKAGFQALAFQMVIVLASIYYLRWLEQEKTKKTLSEDFSQQEKLHSK